MSRVKLSILVPSVPNRIGSCFMKLLESIQKQIGTRENIEILGLFDNKKRTVGEKRQALLDIANGEYVVFIDDDDRIAESYISDIMRALERNPTADCVVFDCLCTINGNRRLYCKYGIEYEYKKGNTGDQWFGKPAHTMVYKAEIAKRHRYTSSSHGEDIDWVKRACLDIKNQVRIDKVLYFYDYNIKSSETQGVHSQDTMKTPGVNV